MLRQCGINNKEENCAEGKILPGNQHHLRHTHKHTQNQSHQDKQKNINVPQFCIFFIFFFFLFFFLPGSRWCCPLVVNDWRRAAGEAKEGGEAERRGGETGWEKDEWEWRSAERREARLLYMRRSGRTGSGVDRACMNGGRGGRRGVGGGGGGGRGRRGGDTCISTSCVRPSVFFRGGGGAEARCSSSGGWRGARRLFLGRNWHEVYSGQGDTGLWVKEGREVEGLASDSHTHPPPISLENTASPFRSWFFRQRWRAAVWRCRVWAAGRKKKPLENVKTYRNLRGK